MQGHESWREGLTARTGSSSETRPVTASPATRVFRRRSDRSRHHPTSLAISHDRDTSSTVVRSGGTSWQADRSVPWPIRDGRVALGVRARAPIPQSAPCERSSSNAPQKRAERHARWGAHHVGRGREGFHNARPVLAGGRRHSMKLGADSSDAAVREAAGVDASYFRMTSVLSPSQPVFPATPLWRLALTRATYVPFGKLVVSPVIEFIAQPSAPTVPLAVQSASKVWFVGDRTMTAPVATLRTSISIFNHVVVLPAAAPTAHSAVYCTVRCPEVVNRTESTAPELVSGTRLFDPKLKV